MTKTRNLFRECIRLLVKVAALVAFVAFVAIYISISDEKVDTRLHYENSGPGPESDLEKYHRIKAEIDREQLPRKILYTSFTMAIVMGSMWTISRSLIRIARPPQARS